jgi:hypothetical protein
MCVCVYECVYMCMIVCVSVVTIVARSVPRCSRVESDSPLDFPVPATPCAVTDGAALQVAIGVFPSATPNNDNLGDARVVRLSGDPRTTPGNTVPQTAVIVHNYNDLNLVTFPGPNSANPHLEFSVTGYGGIATYLNQQHIINGYTGPGAFFDVGAEFHPNSYLFEMACACVVHVQGMCGWG